MVMKKQRKEKNVASIRARARKRKIKRSVDDLEPREPREKSYHEGKDNVGGRPWGITVFLRN